MRPAVAILLALLIVGFVGFVGFETVRQHQLLETRAYDLGIMENVFWNTSQGRLFASSIEGVNHLGVHTSFIFLLLAPFHLLAPRPETLLWAQALLMGAAAWPLFLAARLLLRSERAALLVCALYLLHPAVEGAAFYDFHELAFAPVLFFAAFHGLVARRPGVLFTSASLLLLVKEDCAIVVAALGVAAFLEGRRRTGALLILISASALLLFQGVVIPHFAGGPSSFDWYFAEMTPAGGGPIGVLRTVLFNPLFALRHALTAPKVLFLLETLGPVLFLCLLSRSGTVLVAYGLAISLLASRPYLHQLGFQYPLQLVPEAFAGTLLILGRGNQMTRRLGITPRRALAAMVLVSAFLAYRAGMLSPAADFRGGFRSVKMAMGEAERARYREVVETADLIPPAASVTATETLVPHVARRERVQTLRYADHFGGDYEYFFLLKSDLDPGTRERFKYVLASPAYELVREGTWTLLYRERSGRLDALPGGNDPRSGPPLQ